MAQEVLKKHAKYYSALNEYGRKCRMRKHRGDFVGANPCPICENWSTEVPCEEREQCRTWKHYCFRKAIERALEIKHYREELEYARLAFYADLELDDGDWSAKDKIYFY